MVYWRELRRSHLPVGSLRARIVGGAFWVLAGSVVAQALTAICGIVVARVLGVEKYGALAIITSTIAMFNVIAELSLGLTTNKHVAEFRTSDPARAGRIVALGTLVTVGTGWVVAALVLLFSEQIATQALRLPELSPYLRLGAPLLLFSAVNGVQCGTLAGLESFRIISIGRVLAAAFALPLLIAGVLIGGVAGAIIAQIILSVITFIWFRMALARQLNSAGVVVSYHDAWRERVVLLSFALPSMLAGIMTMPVMWMGNAMLVRSANGLSEMGFFNAANQWRNLIIWAPAAIGQVVLPVLTSLISKGDHQRFARALKLNIAANLLVGLAVAVPVSLCSYWIMGLYGAEFSQRWLALIMLSGAAVLQATINVIGQVIACASRMWWGFLLNMLWAVELLGFTWYLIDFGANGLAAANLLAYTCHLFQVTIYTRWILRYDSNLPAPANCTQIAPQPRQLIN